MLVHGEQNEMGRLKAALIREYEDNPVREAIDTLQYNTLQANNANPRPQL